MKLQLLKDERKYRPVAAAEASATGSSCCHRCKCPSSCCIPIEHIIKLPQIFRIMTNELFFQDYLLAFVLHNLYLLQ